MEGLAASRDLCDSAGDGMDVERFFAAFEGMFPEKVRMRPSVRFSPFKSRRNLPDPCPDVDGFASPKKLRLLNLAVSLLPADARECYLEVGTFLGKSLISALLRNASAPAIACDDFSQFDARGENLARLEANLARYGLARQVRFYNEPFQRLFARWRSEGLPPVGVYFYDGAHDEASQYDAIRGIEPLLADRALCVIDDWRWAPDSRSYAEAGTRRAIAASPDRWEVRYVLPARHNQDVAMWWNGVAVLAFERRP